MLFFDTVPALMTVLFLVTLVTHSFIYSMFSSAATEHCSSFIVNICLSYGSRRYVCIAERNLLIVKTMMMRMIVIVVMTMMMLLGCALYSH